MAGKPIEKVGGVLVESKYIEYSTVKTFAANSADRINETINVAKTDYTPVGIVGIHFWGANNQEMVIDSFNISGNNALVSYRHVPNTVACEVSRIYVEVLYIQN